MRTPIFHVDAFTALRFAGNPAALLPMNGFLADAVLQAVAAENDLAEAAFLVPQGSDYLLRWFTPTTEVPLCGHTTPASAAVVMERLEPGARLPDGLSGTRIRGWSHFAARPADRIGPGPRGTSCVACLRPQIRSEFAL